MQPTAIDIDYILFSLSVELNNRLISKGWPIEYTATAHNHTVYISHKTRIAALYDTNLNALIVVSGTNWMVLSDIKRALKSTLDSKKLTIIGHI